MPVFNRKFKSRLFHVRLLVSTLGLLAALLLAGCQNSKATSEPLRATSVPSATPASVPVATPTPEEADHRPLIVALGDSLTAGYGLDAARAWPSLLQQRLDVQGLPYRIVNKGVSGDTSAGGVSRIEDSLRGDVKILILALGGNDGLRGLPTAELKRNLSRTIEAAQQRKVTVILAGMEAPPNYGADYTADFRNVYRDLAKQYHVILIPFLLQNVGGVADLNQADGIHPNDKGAAIVMENVWRALEPLVK
ncbi:MAG TPA: arylesterase [Blastocatellia bacterium]|nr:arylesterase [Blastocatellia bacterium]